MHQSGIGARGQLYQTLRSLMEQGASVIFASSDPSEIIKLADRVLVLGYGRQISLIDNPNNEGELVTLAHRTESGFQTVP